VSETVVAFVCCCCCVSISGVVAPGTQQQTLRRDWILIGSLEWCEIGTDVVFVVAVVVVVDDDAGAG
jgi:hypothetical protein